MDKNLLKTSADKIIEFENSQNRKNKKALPKATLKDPNDLYVTIPSIQQEKK